MPVTGLTKGALRQRIRQARGHAAADLVIKNTGILDIATGSIRRGDVALAGDVIVGTQEEYHGAIEIDGRDAVVTPGFIDSHVHIESSLLTPSEFARCVVPRGTTTAICDPHEICNVLGIEGLRYILAHAGNLVMDLRVQLPSCVPATELETNGARLEAEDLMPFLDHPAVIGLAEMMNYPGVLGADDRVLDKLVAFAGRHIDGHAPLLRGHALNAYLLAGMRTCHESTSLDEGREKLSKGAQVLVREGSVSKDVAALAPLFDEATWPFLAFCTDDRNPLDLTDEGHIDHCIRKAIACGAPTFSVYRSATWGAAQAFGLRDRGKVAPGYRADLVLLNDLNTCAIATVISAGRVVDPRLLDGPAPVPPVGVRSIRLDPVQASDVAIPASDAEQPVIGVVADRIITEHLRLSLPVRDGFDQPDVPQDVQKICVFARHGTNRNVGRGFVRGFGLKRGAIASSVAHDSHNIVVVGVDDGDMAIAVNRIIELQGGFAVAAGGNILSDLSLPIAGLMSPRSAIEVCDRLRALRRVVAQLGCRLKEPLLQLSFLTLPVVPHLKITDRGMVDVDRFELRVA